MSKVYTVAQKVRLHGGYVYIHGTDDTAFSSNAKLTTYKRGLDGDVDGTLVNWSYKQDDPGASLPEPGGKVYTIQQRVESSDGVLYIPVHDYWFASAAKATTAKRNLEGNGFGGLVIWSFKVDVPPAPVYSTYTVEVEVGNITQSYQVSATSQEAADKQVSNSLEHAMTVMAGR